MKQFIHKITLKKIITFFTLLIFLIILFYRYTIINGIDNFQLIQLYLRTIHENIYNEYGVLYGPGTNFIFFIFSKINFLNLSTINSIATISLIVTLFTSHIICKIYEISAKKYDLFLFFSLSVSSES